MRVIALEEHFSTPAMAAMATPPGRGSVYNDVLARLSPILDDLGEARLADMDAAGLDVQVLSMMAPGAQALTGDEAIAASRAANDHLAEAVRAHPGRFVGMAALPTSDASAAGDELARAVTELGFKGGTVNGTTQGRFLDASGFDPLFRVAQSLDVPLYLHPAPPPVSVTQAYYTGFSPMVDTLLATSGWGWHAEAGLHALRMMLGGVFDRFSRLQVILGHMGEFVPAATSRLEAIFDGQRRRELGLERPVGHYVRENLYYTTSGYTDDAMTRYLVDIVGVDRVMFAVDYPFLANATATSWLAATPLADDEREAIAHRNAERVLGL